MVHSAWETNERPGVLAASKSSKSILQIEEP